MQHDAQANRETTRAANVDDIVNASSLHNVGAKVTEADPNDFYGVSHFHHMDPQALLAYLGYDAIPFVSKLDLSAKMSNESSQPRYLPLELRHSQLVGVARMISHMYAEDSPIPENSEANLPRRDPLVSSVHQSVQICSDGTGVGKTGQVACLLGLLAQAALDYTEVPRIKGWMIKDRTRMFLAYILANPDQHCFPHILPYPL
jgi:hypothetical protein